MSTIQSMRDVIEHDMNGAFKRWEDFDDAVWVVLCNAL
jgi:hypothetical protein